MRFYADLHIHSKHSRATSRDCGLQHLAYWAARKGLRVLGTGDFTHPAWREELRAELTEAESGLFALNAGDAVRFMLTGEIATIYKQGGRTRKVHHAICVPGFAEADRIATALAKLGNVASDGRPILGIDSRQLLGIVLDAGGGSFLFPAHIWTPWFSVLGSKSGFDSLEECYGELAQYVFAVETGLSSDPAMNRRVAGLDRYRLVSNSDAHSPPKLGREACVFDCAVSFPAMRKALETGLGYAGTVEFFPEQGKYHFDGHRKCGVRLEPPETRDLGGVCPVCGKPLTAGVMYRVEELATRRKPRYQQGERFRRLLPLAEVLAQVEGVGATTKRVARLYEQLIGALGPELHILEDRPLEDIRNAGSERLAEAVRRMRAGDVLLQPGYDGEYGTVNLFEGAEKDKR